MEAKSSDSRDPCTVWDSVTHCYVARGALQTRKNSLSGSRETSGRSRQSSVDTSRDRQEVFSRQASYNESRFEHWNRRASKGSTRDEAFTNHVKQMNSQTGDFDRRDSNGGINYVNSDLSNRNTRQESLQRQVSETSSPDRGTQSVNSYPVQAKQTPKVRRTQKASWNSNGSITVLETLPVKCETRVAVTKLEGTDDGQQNKQASRFPSQTRERLPNQTRERFPSHTRDGLPSQTRERFPSQTRDGLPCQTRGGLPCQTRGRIKSQNREKLPTEKQDKFPIQTQVRVSSHSREELSSQTRGGFQNHPRAEMLGQSSGKLPSLTIARSPSRNMFPNQAGDELNSWNKDGQEEQTREKLPFQTRDSLRRQMGNKDQSDANNHLDFQRGIQKESTECRPKQEDCALSSSIEIVPKRSSVPKKTEVDSYYIVRNFALKGRKVINLGDSLQQNRRFSVFNLYK